MQWGCHSLKLGVCLVYLAEDDLCLLSSGAVMRLPMKVVEFPVSCGILLSHYQITTKCAKTG